jgi:hypothetical protein
VTIQGVIRSTNPWVREEFDCVVTATDTTTFDVTVPLVCRDTTAEHPTFRVTVSARGTLKMEPLSA